MCPSGRYPLGETSVLQPVFDVLDSDRDGKISADDLKTFYGASGAATEDDIGSMITMADVNKNGYVEFEEFELVVGERKSSSSSSSPRKAVMEGMFRMMDRDGDGKVGFGDLKDYMAWAGFAASDEDIRAMIRMGGGDEKNGGVCYEGLMKILAAGISA